MDSILYYPPPDLGAGHYLSEGVAMLETYTDGSIESVDDAIAYWNIRKYFNDGTRLITWSDDQFFSYDSMSAKALKEACAFFAAQIRAKGVEVLAREINPHYLNDFWELCCKTKCLDGVTDETIRSLYEDRRIPEKTLFKNEVFAKRFESAILAIMQAYPERYLPVILNGKIVRQDSLDKRYFFPNGLNDSAIDEIAISYIGLPHPNPNYLDIIEVSEVKSGHIFPSTIRVAAKRRSQEIKENRTKDGISISLGVGVSFVPDQEDLVIVSREGTRIHYAYSLDWIRQNTDYATLLNNFIYLFEYVDGYSRFNLHSKQSEISAFEGAIGVETKAAYQFGIAFTMKRNAALIQMKSYREEMMSLGIRVEDAIEWYYGESIMKVFGLSGFRVSLPSEEAVYLEKCRMICPEIENVLKRFTLFVREGEIDEDMLQYESTRKLNEIPSLLQRKYAYGTKDEYSNARYCLCSDQCMLSYDNDKAKDYPNFFIRITSTRVYQSEIEEYLVKDLTWLESNCFIEVASDGLLIATGRARIIHDLWETGYIALDHHSDEDIAVIDGLIADGFIQTGNFLFSQQESDYLSFVLNDALFDNALALRNRYSHGSPLVNDDHELNYNYLLIVFILITIKINDELCIREGHKGSPFFLT